MSNDSNEAMTLFEGSLDKRNPDQGGEGEPPGGSAQFGAARKRRNPFSVVGAALSFVPLVGLVLSVVGFIRSRTRGGVGRTLALVGIVLSILFGGAETYVGTTAPLFDAGCLGANSPASRLRAIQAAPGGNLTQLANELDSIHSDLDTAAGEADNSQVHAKIQSVANDVKSLSVDFTVAQKSGDMTRLIDDETKLQTDGNAADSYCHSL